MADTLWLEIAAIVALVLANGFFALSEFSIIASRKSKLRQRIKTHKYGAVTAHKLHDSPEQFLASIQVGITLFGAVLGVFSGDRIISRLSPHIAASSWAFAAEHAEQIAFWVVVVAITILSVVFGELVPKYLALSSPERYAGLVAKPVSWFTTGTSYFSRLLSMMSRGVIKIMGIRSDPMAHHITEAEINHMIHEGAEKGIFDRAEQQLIRSVFAFSDSTVRRAMKPRTMVAALDKRATAQEVFKLISQENYSRYPVYDGTIDRVVGILNVKDVLMTQTNGQAFSMAAVMREAHFVPDSMPLSSLLLHFRRGKGHMAIVLDEFGGTSGIVTLEDVLEELVGEIQDEHDFETPPLVKHSETVAFADGSVWPGEINNLMQTHLPEDNAETLAGLLIDGLGRLPEKNDSVRVGDLIMTVVSKDKHRMLRIKLEKTSAQVPERKS